MKSITLTELLIVVMIASILAGLAVPIYVRMFARTRESEGWSFLTAIRSSELRYYNERDEIFTGNPAELDLDAVPPSFFTYAIQVGGVPPRTFQARACPVIATCGGCRRLCINQDGVQGIGVAACPGACP